MRLYFIRHAENQANVDRILSHRIVDFSLTAKGIWQTECLAQWLSYRRIVGIYSSPLKRAAQTAAILADRLGLSDPTILEDLRELNVGMLDGKRGAEAWELHDSIVRRWIAGEADARFEGGESHVELLQRLDRAIQLILSEARPVDDLQSVAVVTHGGIMECGLPWLCEDISVAQAQHGLLNTATVIVDSTQTGLACVQWGLAEHLRC